MSTRGKSDKSIPAWLHHSSTKRIQSPKSPPLLMLHHQPTPEASSYQTKKSCYSKNCTYFNSVPSYLLHNVDICYADLVQCTKLKPDLV